jgi:F-type H+-transporting ATPase subunit c
MSGNHLLPAGPKEERMNTVRVALIVLVALMIMVPAALAQETGAIPAVSRPGVLPVAIGFAMALAAFGGALGQSRVGAAACEGMARNPGAGGAIRAAMILGLVFIETLSLLTFVIAIVLYLKM